MHGYVCLSELSDTLAATSAGGVTVLVGVSIKIRLMVVSPCEIICAMALVSAQVPRL